MLRQAIRGAAVLVLFVAVLDSTGRGQPVASKDRVYWHDKKDGTTKSVEGELKAIPTGFQVIAANDKKVAATVTAADLIRVVPADIPGVERSAVMEGVTAEEKGNWEAARKIHDGMLDKVKGAPEKVTRYLKFRQAMTAAHAADAAPDDTVAQAKAGEAVGLLTAFLSDFKGGWEAWPATEACARLQASGAGQKAGEPVSERAAFEAAARTWGKLAKATDLPPDLRADAALQEIDLLIRARRFPDAGGLIAEAAKTAPAGSVREKLAIYGLAAKAESAPLDAVAKIEAEIAKTKDPGIRAAGFGMLGELYLLADKPREAMWQYLWVEVVYNQDRDEVVKALQRLAEVYKLQGDEDRAKAYQEKLRRYRGSL